MTKNKSIFKVIMENFLHQNFKNKRVIIRVDFNVPLSNDFKVTDPTRIEFSKRTIQEIINRGGKCILLSHMGRPAGREFKYSLSHIVYCVEEILGVSVKFCDDCIGNKAIKAVDSLKEGDVILMENVRFYPEEIKGDVDFARKLSQLGDYFVNDAFGSVHRAHSSTSIIADFFKGKKFAGILLEKEIKSIDRVLKNGENPITAIVGGAKVSSKITVIENLLERIDYLIIGGGMVYTFIRAKGGQIGDSICEDEFCEYSLKIIELANQKGVKLFLPEDVVIGNKFSEKAEINFSSVYKIPSGWQGLDAGPKSIKTFSQIIQKSNTILWNGPIGVFELEPFSKGTKILAEEIVKRTERGAFSLVGGGDSVSAVKKFGLSNGFSYISTGGGAMLEYLEGKKLPGILALMREK